MANAGISYTGIQKWNFGIDGNYRSSVNLGHSRGCDYVVRRLGAGAPTCSVALLTFRRASMSRTMISGRPPSTTARHNEALSVSFSARVTFRCLFGSMTGQRLLLVDDETALVEPIEEVPGALRASGGILYGPARRAATDAGRPGFVLTADHRLDASRNVRRGTGRSDARTPSGASRDYRQRLSLRAPRTRSRIPAKAVLAEDAGRCDPAASRSSGFRFGGRNPEKPLDREKPLPCRRR